MRSLLLASAIALAAGSGSAATFEKVTGGVDGTLCNITAGAMLVQWAEGATTFYVDGAKSDVAYFRTASGTLPIQGEYRNYGAGIESFIIELQIGGEAEFLGFLSTTSAIFIPGEGGIGDVMVSVGAVPVNKFLACVAEHTGN